MPHAVHLSSVHQPFDTRIFHKQLCTLSENGYQTTLIVHHDESTTRNGVYIDALGETASRIERWANLPTIANRAKQHNADIYHFHDPELLPVGWYLAKYTDGKVVYDVHENYADAIRVREWIPDSVKPILMRAFPEAEAKIANSLDYVITADDSTRDRMQERLDVPVTSVRNFPKTDDISFVDFDVERRSEFVLAYVGGLDRERGLMTMLEVTAELRAKDIDVCLWLIGPFQNEAIENEAQELINAADISDSVRTFGYIDHSKMFSYLILADIGLLLVDENRFKWNVPTKFFEYLYCKLPVVSTDVPSLRRYRNDSYCITVPEADTEKIVSSIIGLLDDEEKRSGMGISGYKKVKSEFSWGVEQKKLLDTYESLLVTESRTKS